MRELTVVWQALQAFSQLLGQNIVVMTDNQVTLANSSGYEKRKVESDSILHLCLGRDSSLGSISCVYPRDSNFRDDGLNQNMPASVSYHLSSTEFTWICVMFRTLQLDLFESSYSAMLPRICSETWSPQM